MLMRTYGALAVVLAALMVATSTGLEATVFEIEAAGGELPAQVDGMMVNNLRVQVRNAVIEAVSNRRAKRELKQKEADEAETRAAEAKRLTGELAALRKNENARLREMEEFEAEKYTMAQHRTF